MSPILAVLLDPILPVFAILALGYGFGRLGFVSVDDARTLNRVVMILFLPIMMIGVTSRAPIDDFRLDPLLVYLGAEAVVLLAGFLIARFVFRLPPPESFLIAFGAIFTNTVMYVMPLSVLIYGESAALPVMSVTTMDSTLVFAIAIVMTQLLTRQGGGLGATIGSLLLNPIIVSIAIGLAINLAKVETPATLDTFIAFNSAATPPLALFALGVVMSAVRFRIDGVVATFCIINMAIFPAAVFYGLQTFAPADPGGDLYFFAAAGPAGAMAFNLALLHNVRPNAIGQVIVLTSVLTLGSLAVLA